jgi:hypothetical protein
MEIVTPEIVQTIVSLLGDPNNDVRIAAVESVAELSRHGKYVSFLLQGLI